ncbi:hypothetical protein PG993_010587 [Apiospora rasikravindrae]|uniref:Uncharacterized protein n=1 Tax=Apiospora rasikravindrae TaxID=990691 RepID=A0ABR1SMQ5_9PEZI
MRANVQGPLLASDKDHDLDLLKEWRPTGLGERERPPCCNHVRQVIIGDCKHGGLHSEDTYVGRFTEEASRNWKYLESVELHLTDTILTGNDRTLAENIGFCENLKALKLCGACDSWPSEVHYAEYAPLAIVRGLEHLTVNNLSGKIPYEILWSILGNSAATLRGLMMRFIPHGNLTFMFKELAFSNLQSVGLDCDWEPEEEDMLDSLFTAIDFPNLAKLALYIPPVEISRRLTHLFRTVPEDVQPKLRTLVIEMYATRHHALVDRWHAVMRFIASFHTLTGLEIPNNVHYKLDTTIDPAFSDIQLRVILVHKGLETLDISYSGATVGYRCMLQSAETIRSIVSALPRLRVLKIAPEEGQMVRFRGRP